MHISFQSSQLFRPTLLNILRRKLALNIFVQQPDWKCRHAALMAISALVGVRQANAVSIGLSAVDPTIGTVVPLLLDPACRLQVAN